MTKNEFKVRFKHDRNLLHNWLIQHSDLYYSFTLKREYEASQRSLEKQS